MEASGAVAKAQEVEFNALEGSLSIMSKGASSPEHIAKEIGADQPLPGTVLNDVLDLYVSYRRFQINGSELFFSNRMDSGRLEMTSSVCNLPHVFTLLLRSQR